MGIRGGFFVALMLIPSMALANTEPISDSLNIGEVVVTGTRYITDIRHQPQTVTVVGRDMLTANERTSVLPTLMEQVPGLMLTSRGVMSTITCPAPEDIPRSIIPPEAPDDTP